MNQAECANADASDPIVVIYHHAEGIERVISLAGMPVLDLIARHEIPYLTVTKVPGSPPDAPVVSAVRRLSGATMLVLQTRELLAQDFGLASFLSTASPSIRKSPSSSSETGKKGRRT